MFNPTRIAFNPVRSRIMTLCLTAILAATVTTYLKGADDPAPGWKQCGWGGGGFYYSAVFHPTKDGVIYLGGDVNGVYRSDDHGLHFKMINNGLAAYGVFSLAVDETNPDTVYAANDGGLCKSTDEGEHWQLLPHTGPGDLRITGEKNLSIRSIAVDPKNGNIVFAASPAGKVYKSTDGGQTWASVYSPAGEASDPGTTRVQFGKNDGEFFAGLWFNLSFPAGASSKDCTGFGFEDRKSVV